MDTWNYHYNLRYILTFLLELDLELGFVPFTVVVSCESPINSSCMKDSLKYLRRSFCCESCSNTIHHQFLNKLQHHTCEACLHPVLRPLSLNKLVIIRHLSSKTHSLITRCRLFIIFRVRTVQPKMFPGTVRELCIFGPGRSGDFHEKPAGPKPRTGPVRTLIILSQICNKCHKF